MFSYQDQNHQVIGPLPTGELRQLVTSGVVSRHTLVRKEGTEFWQPAMQFEEFGNFFKSSGEPGEPAAEKPSAGQPEGSPPPRQPGSPEGFIEVSAGVSPEKSGATVSSRPSPEPAPPSPEPSRTASNPEAPESEPPKDAVDLFFMIGGDGREYGPVTADRLREWIGQRRADERTLVRRQDGKDFAPLNAWPEFADALAGSKKSPAPPLPPPLDSAKADELAEEIIGRGINLSVGSCFSRSWKLYTEHFGILTGTTAIVLVILSALHSVPGAGNIAAIALGGVFVAGLSLVFLKAIRGQKAEVNDLFAGFNRGFVPLLLAGTIVFILVTAGLILCVLPGIYLAVAWMFAFPLVYERLIDFWPAMELSRKVVHERWWELFALALGATALFVLGLMIAIVGVFVTAPIAFGAITYAYEDIFGEIRPAPPADNQTISGS